MKVSTMEMLTRLIDNKDLVFADSRNLLVDKVGWRTNGVAWINDNRQFDRLFYLCDESLGLTWKLVQKPVDFMTAINSGERIRSESKNGYYTATDLFRQFALMGRSGATDMINGKWYIEDSEQGGRVD